MRPDKKGNDNGKSKDQVKSQHPKTSSQESEGEGQARRILEDNGYYVTRAAGSLGLWDLVAVPSRQAGDKTRLIQVKANRWPSKKEHGVLVKASRQYSWNVRCEIWVWKDRATSFDSKRL